MLRRVAAAAALSVVLVVGAGALGGVGVGDLGSTAPAAAQSGPPSSEPATDLRSDKLSGPFLNDSNPTRAVGVPMLVAGIAIMAVIITLITRSRRRTQDKTSQ